MQLKKAGHNYKGLCPFHNEKSPSFVVSPEKQICHCFGCNKGGDIFSFVQELEGVSFTEAMQILADRAGVKIERKSGAKAKINKTEKEEFFAAHELAADFFEKELWNTNDGKKVLEYLHRRGLKDETIKGFRIGFAPDRYDALYPMLLKRGVKKDTLIKSGLVSTKKVGADEVYDKYRARLIFPIFDYLGKICGFGGRALKSEQMPKYLNSPENVIYNKSKVLYGLSHAKKSIKEQDAVVLVEGYFDVVLPVQEGVENVVATCGTALTSDQGRMLARLTKNVVSCFDNDGAGFEATKRAYSVALDHEMTMKTVSLDGEKDPAEYVLDKGGAEFGSAVSVARDFMDFYIARLTKEFDISEFSGRRKVIGEVLPLYKRMGAAGKDYYLRQLARKLEISERALQDELDHMKLPASHPARKAEVQIAPRKFSLSQLVLGLLIIHPKMAEKLLPLVSEKLLDEGVKSIYRALCDQYNSSRLPEGEWSFDGLVSADERQELDVLALYVEDRYREVTGEAICNEVEQLVKVLKKERLSEQIMAMAKSGEIEKVNELLEQKNLLS